MWMGIQRDCPGTLKRVSTGETAGSPTTAYLVLPSSISSLSVKQLIPPELCAEHSIPAAPVCLCVLKGLLVLGDLELKCSESVRDLFMTSL